MHDVLVFGVIWIAGFLILAAGYTAINLAIPGGTIRESVLAGIRDAAFVITAAAAGSVLGILAGTALSHL